MILKIMLGLLVKNEETRGLQRIEPGNLLHTNQEVPEKKLLTNQSHLHHPAEIKRDQTAENANPLKTPLKSKENDHDHLKNEGTLIKIDTTHREMKTDPETAEIRQEIVPQSVLKKTIDTIPVAPTMIVSVQKATDPTPTTDQKIINEKLTTTEKTITVQISKWKVLLLPTQEEERIPPKEVTETTITTEILNENPREIIENVKIPAEIAETKVMHLVAVAVAAADVTDIVAKIVIV